MTPRAAVLLSYFTGLAPVGETFEVPRKWIMEDLEIGSSQTFAVLIRELVSTRRIRQIARGYAGTSGIFTVIRRLEQA
ncbi:hypothetical protein ACFFTN_01255 [Aminobacter aganoensis]|uniref:Uncharacterized protein n=1 Tax=Aminobacter aganoensis TaxID=83264 RepID=A0A7X0F5K1_9HYPH|nr:hypothetical protein [Aminobacter aganoensis]MBB6353514.1 hypothetical protein [Aminobacter aganoensis]